MSLVSHLLFTTLAVFPQSLLLLWSPRRRGRRRPRLLAPPPPLVITVRCPIHTHLQTTYNVPFTLRLSLHTVSRSTSQSSLTTIGTVSVSCLGHLCALRGECCFSVWCAVFLLSHSTIQSLFAQLTGWPCTSCKTMSLFLKPMATTIQTFWWAYPRR